MLHFQVKFEDKVHLTNCYRYLNDQEEFLIPNSFSFQSDHLVHHDLVLASEVHYQVVNCFHQKEKVITLRKHIL